MVQADCKWSGSDLAEGRRAYENLVNSKLAKGYVKSDTTPEVADPKPIKARVLPITLDMSAADKHHHGSPIEGMVKDVGKILEFVPMFKKSSEWYRTERFSWHESWLDFDYDKNISPDPTPIPTKSLFTQEVKVLSITIGEFT